MKAKIFSVIALVCGLFATSCTSDMEYKDTAVTAVKQLYSPNPEAKITLVASATASAFFEWAPANAEDGCAPLYEIVFDKADGDFSHPLYSLPSDDNGTRTYATVLHKTLNKVAGLAGYASGETGAVKWTVRTSRGIMTKLGEESRLVNITRLVGFDEIPTQLFITGAATEGGEDVAQAIACSSPEKNKFEVFTRLEAGKPFKLIDQKEGKAATFYLEGTVIKEATEAASTGMVEKTGIYRIVMDFEVATCSMTEVTGCGFFFCPSNEITIQMSYAGNGIWKGNGVQEFKQESWGRDERYKIVMQTSDGNIYWGPVNGAEDGRPGDPNNDDLQNKYFQCKEWPASQWDNKWKLHGNWDGAPITVTLYLNADQPYTHTITAQ